MLRVPSKLEVIYTVNDSNTIVSFILNVIMFISKLMTANAMQVAKTFAFKISMTCYIKPASSQPLNSKSDLSVGQLEDCAAAFSRMHNYLLLVSRSIGPSEVFLHPAHD